MDLGQRGGGLESSAYDLNYDTSGVGSPACEPVDGQAALPKDKPVCRPARRQDCPPHIAVKLAEIRLVELVLKGCACVEL